MAPNPVSAAAGFPLAVISKASSPACSPVPSATSSPGNNPGGAAVMDRATERVRKP